MKRTDSNRRSSTNENRLPCERMLAAELAEFISARKNEPGRSLERFAEGNVRVGLRVGARAFLLSAHSRHDLFHLGDLRELSTLHESESGREGCSTYGTNESHGYLSEIKICRDFLDRLFKVSKL